MRDTPRQKLSYNEKRELEAMEGAVLDAEERGELRPGGVIVEGTAGNTGIGLALVRKIVQEHGGTINLKSAEGKGARFRFTWPKSG